MARFASPERQAAEIMKRLQGPGNVIESTRSTVNYEAALTNVARFMQEERLGTLRDLRPDDAIKYLETRAESVGQSVLNQERQAIQLMMQHTTIQLAGKERLRMVRSELDEALRSRAYTTAQVGLVAQAQTKPNSLSTELAHAAGLRAHELFTLHRASERKPDPRPALPQKFSGRQGELYTVVGKGGLCRHVLIPLDLAIQLEARRLETPRRVNDRGVHYLQHYDLNGGNRWSSSFTTAAQRSLGWSEGAHGVRHTYAQQRMRELQTQGLTRDLALEVVSQEMGHFRPEITEVYLR